MKYGPGSPSRVSLQPVRMVTALCALGLFGLIASSCWAGPQAAPAAVMPLPPQQQQVAAVMAPAPALAPPESIALPAEEPAPAPEATPIAQDLAQDFRSITEDRPPTHIVRGIHYIVSNENRHYLYRAAVRESGGLFIGVGTDQNYLIAGWARPEVLVLMDFDQVVVDLHRVYKLAFLNADSPRAFLKMWSPTHMSKLHALIDQSDETPEVRRRMHRALNISRHRVERRLYALQYRYTRKHTPSFVTDAEQYAYVVGMFKNDRVFMLRGDLTANQTVNGLAQVARAHHLPVRVLYLSNAERYFPYNDDFRASMLNLPMDEHTLVLRTSDFHSGYYQYTAQGGANFQAWLRSDQTKSVERMLAYRVLDHQDRYGGLGQIQVTPDHLPPLAQSQQRQKTAARVRVQPGDRVCCVEASRQTPSFMQALQQMPPDLSLSQQAALY